MTFSRLSRRDRSRALPPGDWLWGGLGLSLAGLSASFAAYMIANAPAEVTGSGSNYFSVFARFDRRAVRVADAVTPAAADRHVAGTGIDPEPTGSIPVQPRPAPPGGTLPASETPLQGFVLRDVRGGKALIEHGRKLILVSPGTVLDDAGAVLAIERRAGGWVVRTASGVIESP